MEDSLKIGNNNGSFVATDINTGSAVQLLIFAFQQFASHPERIQFLSLQT